MSAMVRVPAMRRDMLMPSVIITMTAVRRDMLTIITMGEDYLGHVLASMTPAQVNTLIRYESICSGVLRP
jgi:hypothetical protein